MGVRERIILNQKLVCGIQQAEYHSEVVLFGFLLKTWHYAQEFGNLEEYHL